MFTDLFPSRQGRPSVPADVMATVITLQALHGLSDSETVDAVTFDLRWKAACGLPVTAAAFHPTTYQRKLRLGDALYQHAFCAVTQSAGARRYYDEHRARGNTHNQPRRAARRHHLAQ